MDILEERFVNISYKDIQYVEFSQNIFARVVKLQKGEVHLLASTANGNRRSIYFDGKRRDNQKTAFESVKGS